jgi:multicomponent Na+:H+ antiporter subunit D
MLSWFVIVPILIAIFLYINPFEKAGKVIAITVQSVLIGCAFYLFFACKEADIITHVGNFDGVLGITLKADTLSSVFIVLTTFIFSIASLFNFYEGFNRLFWFILFIWEGLLIGIFLTCDLFNIFVLIEVVTVVVSVMIMFKRDNRSMYDGMLYLMINTVAIQFYLFGIGYIYKLTGTFDMDAASLALQSLEKSEVMLPYALIMTAITLKCALVPLFSWLPRAHGTPGAPTVVSAILSGLHVKVGIYLFIRLQGVFQGIAASEFFLVIGIITGIAGFMLALSQSDIKLILAYHTISQIGMIMIGLNVPDAFTYTGGVYHIINHAFFKSALFLSAGIIADVYGTRNIYQIRGVLRRMPFIGSATIMAVFGITGAPLFNRSISKYFIMSGTNWAVTAAMMFINLGTVISFIKFSSMLFGRYEGDQGDKKIAVCQRVAILLLSALCLAGGILGRQAISFLFNVSVSIDAAGYLEKTGLFLLSVAVGFVIYRYYITKSKLFKRIYDLELGFRGICALIGIFFAMMLIFLGITNGMIVLT